MTFPGLHLIPRKTKTYSRQILISEILSKLYKFLSQILNFHWLLRELLSVVNNLNIRPIETCSSLGKSRIAGGGVFSKEYLEFFL